MDLGTVDTPFTRWLREKIGPLALNEVERRSRRNGTPVSASSLSGYLNDGVIPTKPLILRMAAFWGVNPREIVALLPGPLGITAVGATTQAAPTLAGVGTVGLLARVDRVRAELDTLEAQLKAQLEAGEITDPDTRAFLDKINRPNGSAP